MYRLEQTVLDIMHLISQEMDHLKNLIEIHAAENTIAISRKFLEKNVFVARKLLVITAKTNKFVLYNNLLSCMVHASQFLYYHYPEKTTKCLDVNSPCFVPSLHKVDIGVCFSRRKKCSIKDCKTSKYGVCEMFGMVYCEDHMLLSKHQQQENENKLSHDYNPLEIILSPKRVVET